MVGLKKEMAERQKEVKNKRKMIIIIINKKNSK